ncbi:MAG: ABC transporter ATP-binding protein [bacterium]
MDSPAIKAEKLNKTYKVPDLKSGFKGTLLNLFHRQHHLVRAVNDISFDITPGELVSYIGPNGAGKSTTIKMLTGIINPDSGNLQILGQSYNQHRNKILKSIGAMFGNRSRLLWNLPVMETYRFFKDLYEIEDKDYRQNLEFLCSNMEIEDIVKKQARVLSLGQRIRCELVAILLHSPEIVFLDEPTIGLDSWAKWKIREELKRINRELKTTIIITSHDTNDVDIASRIILIDQGKKLFDGKKKNFIDQYSQQDILVKIEFGAGKTVHQHEFENIIKPKKIEACEKNNLIFKFNRENPLFQKLREIDYLHPIVDFHLQTESLDEVIRNIYEHSK